MTNDEMMEMIYTPDTVIKALTRTPTSPCRLTRSRLT